MVKSGFLYNLIILIGHPPWSGGALRSDMGYIYLNRLSTAINEPFILCEVHVTRHLPKIWHKSSSFYQTLWQKRRLHFCHYKYAHLSGNTPAPSYGGLYFTTQWFLKNRQILSFKKFSEIKCLVKKYAVTRVQITKDRPIVDSKDDNCVTKIKYIMYNVQD